MGLPSLTAPLLVLTAGAILIAVGVRALARRRREGRSGRLISTDEPARRGPELRSARYRLVGRPDELRQGRDGALVPVEIKSRSAPPRGPPPSHRVQVWAYCLLVEESTGRSPPYGLLRYRGGEEFRVPWEGTARREVIELLFEIRAPYDGRATPTPGKCAGCRWRPGCDARAA